MEDDLTFGASVWGSNPTPTSVSDTKPPISLSTTVLPAPGSEFGDSSFEDFEDFNTAPTSAVDGGDDFGDFEDFEGTIDVAANFDDHAFSSDMPPQEWHALRLDPLPERAQLAEEIQSILSIIWADEDISRVTTDDPIREAEGIAQILTTPESREMYKVLLQTPPLVKPPNWTRSRIRRLHLIALGIPVNLDEMLPSAQGKALPPLEISTRPSSTPPSVNGRGSMSVHSTRPGTPQPSRQNSSVAQFGPGPNLDIDRINALLALETENLNIQPLAVLERHLADLRTETANTSNLLTHLLQTKDSLQQDSETYNGLIAELVGEAQKIKSGKQWTGNRRSGVV
ncbi:hypothetical protein AGABI1DRAFT_113255 [Agaricus bisporus var. burnettii JB137-S8]|uniref:Uncharacterized protein n=2 Tax=Agaricus bisporus var. burnettii TaxID=192524 RepID=K5XXJ5_AGABU|nr:uncharacterized protein AGABI1DRAFT_113255 [Agaricus bisporus var. burnettii JB137-S8]EKM80025.1 hypothetical protein AGABI1DRAFT_113255 [Agaricus bisporus var. burnettii JB137-S8]KAF7775903.1 hypothetical protein Agabi119p4_4296 [Agaricus bisporus var. burnettii]